MSSVPVVRPLEPSASRGAPYQVAREVFALACALIEAVAREARVRRDMSRLAEFDDHMLRDLGLVREDIESAVRHGRDDFKPR